MREDLPNGWQHESVRLALRHITDYGCAIDVGAHRGIITGLLLKYFTSVVAIEPTDLCQRIPASARRHKLALGAAEGVGALQPFGDNTGQTRVVAGQGVVISTLDTLCAAYQDRPTFIKLDVEGMELDALRGGEHTIRLFQPVIMVEENGLGAHYGHADNAVFDLLSSWGAVRLGIAQQWTHGTDWIYGWTK